MLTFNLNRAAVMLLVALLVAPTALVAYDAAMAADLAAVGLKPKDSASAKLEIKPSKRDFGKVRVFLTSTPLTVTATNKSKSASIDFAGIVASPPFAIQTDGCSVPLAAGTSCEVSVVFEPTAIGKV